ncbi:hypothetical protein JW905_08780, partial [bacterium]|nr:hypothetical protein [candidate division CSSED10-310 bacterium]
MRKRREAVILLVLAALCLFGLRPLLWTNHAWNGHDLLYGLQRIAAAERAIRDGQWFPRWSDELYGGYGYPLLQFYPPLFSLTAAYLCLLLGLPVLTSAKLLIAAAYIGSGYFTFLFLRDLWAPPLALAGAIVFLYFPYHTSLIYTRGAMAEFLALMFMPLALWSLRRLLVGGGRRSFLLTAGAGGLLLLSHNAVWLMAAPFLALFIVLHGWRKGVRRMGTAVLALAAGLGWTAWYWVPAFVEKRYVAIGNLVSSDNVNYRANFIPLRDFLLFDHHFFGISALLLSLFMLSWLWCKPWHPEQRRDVWFHRVAVLGALFLSTHLSRWIWDGIGPLQFIGYPWRFMGLAGLFAACLMPAVLEKFEMESRWSLLPPALALMLFLPLGMKYANPAMQWFDEIETIGYEASRDGCSSTVVADEYRPVWVRRPPCEDLGTARDRFKVLNGTADIVVAAARSNYLELAVAA